jgi:hypothetical protein
MKVLQVTPTYYPATYWGGPIFSTHALCNALATRHDIELRVLTTDAAGPKRAQRLKADAFPTRFPAGYDIYFTRRILLGIRALLAPPATGRCAIRPHLERQYTQARGQREEQ